MKKIIAAITLVLLTVLTFAQTHDEDIFSTSTKLDGKTYSIIKLDVYSYYNLKNNYDTKLKREVFEKSEEYKAKRNELIELRKNWFYIKDEKYFNAGNNDMFKYPNYNTEKKGFEIYISHNYGYAPKEGSPKKCVQSWEDYNVHLGSITTYTKPFLYKGTYKEYYLAKMSPEIGLEIENDKDNVELFFFFKPTGMKKLANTFLYVRAGQSESINYDCVNTSQSKIIIRNKITGKIYYEKTFNSVTKK